MTATGRAAPAEVLILPGRRRLGVLLAELAESWDLVWILAWRDVRVRYAQTVLGGAWAVIQPAVMLVVLSFVFGSVLRVRGAIGGPPYPLIVIVGVVAWNFFSQGAIQAGSGIVASQSLVTKIYFPRLVIPLSKVVASLVDLGVGTAFLGALLAWYGMSLRRELLWLPAIVGLLVILTGAVGICLSALTVRFRDLTHTMPFLSQVGLYASPIAYPAALVPDVWRPYYFLNPVAGVVEALRWSLLGTDLDASGLLISAITTGCLLLLGFGLFRQVDAIIADVV